MKNWAGNFEYQAQLVFEPRSIADAQEVVQKSLKLKVYGSRHSFNHVADTTDTHVSLQHLNRIVSIDEAAQTVTFEGGIRYGELVTHLHEHGFALHNMASLPHITVAGACATATHGSGEKNGNLATAVRGLDIITGSGEIVTFAGDDLAGAAVHLGALGIVARMTLAIQPTYQVHQRVFREMPFSQMLEHFDEIQASAYSVSLFTGWEGDSINENTINQVWLKRHASEGDLPDSEFFGAVAAQEKIHPIPDFADMFDSCTEQLGIVGSWYERLPHFKLAFVASAGEELQSEYFVSREHAQSALEAMRSVEDKIALFVYCSEIRTIAADDLWMSPCYQQDSVAIHFTWKPMGPEVKSVLPEIEGALRPFGVKPHWGKLFTIKDFRYEKLDDFREMVSKHDPNRKFGNAFLEEFIY